MDVPAFSCIGLGVLVAAGRNVGVCVRGMDEGIGVSVVAAGLVLVLPGIGSIWIASVPQAEIKQNHETMNNAACIIRNFMFASPFNPVCLILPVLHWLIHHIRGLFHGYGRLVTNW